MNIGVSLLSNQYTLHLYVFDCTFISGTLLLTTLLTGKNIILENTVTVKPLYKTDDVRWKTFVGVGNRTQK